MITVDDVILPEREVFLANAGTTRENYFLYGLRFKITVRVSGTITAVYLYSSDQPENEDNRFDFTSNGNGVYTYEETAGQGATALSLAEDDSANFEYGIKFYFRIKIISDTTPIIIDRIFWVRSPKHVLLFLASLLSYESPFPVLIGTSTVSFSVAPDAKDESSKVFRGGVATVEVFTTPTAPSTGDHVAQVSETDVDSLSQITLPSRDNAGSIPSFIAPPGAPDFSRYYHYVTFRLRSKQGSAYYRDIPVIFFAARDCAPEGGPYGWGSTGSPTVSAPTSPPALTIITETPSPPLTVCSSYVDLVTNVNINMYAQYVEVVAYSASSGGTELARGRAALQSATNLRMTRRSFGGDTRYPISGYFAIEEYGPDRTSSNRIESHVDQCYEPVPSGGYEITDITYNSVTGKAEVTTTAGSAVFDSTETYYARMYDSQYGGSISEIFAAEYTSAHVISFPVSADKSGYFSIVQNASEITAPLFQADITITTPDSNFWRYNVSTNTWEDLSATNTPDNREQCSMFVLSDKIYIRGGKGEDGTVLSDIHEYDPSTNTWTQLPTPTITQPDRYAHAEFPLTGRASSCLVGGFKTGEVSFSAPTYEFTPPNTYSAIGISSSEVTRSIFSNFWYANPPIGVGNDKYLWGKHSVTGQIYSNAEYYMKTLTTWHTIATTGFSAQIVDYPALCTGEEEQMILRLWSIGGIDVVSENEIKQVYYTQFTSPGNTIVNYQKADAPIAAAKWAAAYDSSGVIIVFGGKTGATILDSTYSIDESTGTWTEKSPSSKPPARYNHKMVALSGYIYMFGGLKS